MDIEQLFFACRIGDLSRVRDLVEYREVDLNVRDQWDSTPLYYACFCGHEELVKYLLENGARCEANTFDGERCLYGALTDKIRNTLRNYKAVTAHTIRRDLYCEFLRRLLERGPYEDVKFMVHGESFKAHRCILSARSDYLADMFRNKWKDRQIINITHSMVTPKAFKTMLQWLYTDRLEAHLDELEDIFVLAKQCRLTALVEQLENKMRQIVTYESSKPGMNVTLVCLEPEPESKNLQLDLGALADWALPDELRTEADVELPFAAEPKQNFADMFISVQGHRFLCHKAFFCARSDYFKALLEDHFGELSDQDNLPVVSLHEVTVPIFMHILDYMYEDSCDLMPHDVYEVLCAADMYLLPGLKKQCAGTIAQCLDTDNVTNILKSARLFNLARLESQCAEFIASNVEKMVQNEEFVELVKEDAANIKGREETDSIDIIDEVRFYISNFVQTYSEIAEAEHRLSIIDQLLEDLGLDA